MDWSKPYKQTFEYYEVDKGTFAEKRKLETVTACSINDDSSDETIETASITVDEPMGQTYIRAYMVAEQDGAISRVPLATVFVQTPSLKWQGVLGERTLDCYSTLYPMKMKLCEIGMYLPAGGDALSYVAKLADSVCHCAVAKPTTSALLANDMVAQSSDTYLSFAKDVLKEVGYHLEIDSYGTVSISPDIAAGDMIPAVTFSDDAASIVYPDIDDGSNWADVPNVVEVTVDADSTTYLGRAVNDDENDPMSTASRLMEVGYRESASNVPTTITADAAQSYADYLAKKLLKEKKSATRTVMFKHGFHPDVRIGRCVAVNITRNRFYAALQVTKRQLECSTGCMVTTTGTMTDDRWEI